MAQERSSMKNFFAAMGAQMMGGYGAKTISTPMGPFQWDDNLQVWVNINNGMQMNNIAFQDAMAMVDYNTAAGDESQFVCSYDVGTGSEQPVSINVTNDNTTYTEFPTTALDVAITCNTIIDFTGDTFATPADALVMEYAVDAASSVWTVWDWANNREITLVPANTKLKFRVKTKAGQTLGAKGAFFINNVSKNASPILRVSVTLV